MKALLAPAFCLTAVSLASAGVGYRVLDLPYEQKGQAKTLTVAVWHPEPMAEGARYPVLVFSHGYGGGGLGAQFLTEKLAGRGWIVAAPDHGDAESAARIRGGRSKNFTRKNFLKHAQEIASSSPQDRSKYLYRLDEMRLVIDRLFDSAEFGPHLDKDRLAVGGHSMGGYTALGLCGTIPERQDPRIKAVLLFSTGAGAYLYTEEELAKVKIPSMLFMGERERTQTRGKAGMTELEDKIFRNLPPPKYFLEVRGAGHFSFNNGSARTLGSWLFSGTQKQLEVTRRYSIAFLEKFVAGRSEEGVLAQQDRMLTRYLTGAASPR